MDHGGSVLRRQVRDKTRISVGALTYRPTHDPTWAARSGLRRRHEADLDPSTLLITPTTAPLAALACHTTPEQLAYLTSATELIKADTDPDRGARLVGAAITLASIVLPGSAIIRALRAADMPVPARDTPLDRMLFEEGRREEATTTAAALIRQRFGDDPRVPALAGRLAELPGEDRITRITTTAGLEDLLD